MTFPDPYAGSAAVQQLRAHAGPIRIAFLDIDSTLTGDPAGADRVRTRLAELGYITAFVTSRTEEMVMTASAALISRRSGALLRPEPRLGRRGTRRFYVPPEEIEPRGILDGEIIAGSSGSRIFLRQPDGGYLPDREYGMPELPPEAWREEAVSLLAELNRPDPMAEPAAIESVAAYQNGIADVFPPDYRLELHFESVSAKTQLRRRLACLRHGPSNTFARRVHLLDDSHPGEDRYKAFLLPRWASKACAVTRIVSAMRAPGGRERMIDLLFVGDSYPDLAMGLFGAPGCEGTLFLVAGSRLTDPLLSPTVGDFAGEGLFAIKRRLQLGASSGVFRFRVPRHRSVARALVVGDVAYPAAGPVASIELFLGARPRCAR